MPEPLLGSIVVGVLWAQNASLGLGDLIVLLYPMSWIAIGSRSSVAACQRVVGVFAGLREMSQASAVEPLADVVQSLGEEQASWPVSSDRYARRARLDPDRRRH